LTVSTYILSTAAGVVVGNNCGDTVDGNTIVGSKVYAPAGIFIDTSSILYYSEFNGYCRVRKFALSNGIVTTVAGAASCAVGASSGIATSISLNNIYQIWVDPSFGAVYIAEYSSCQVRKVLGGIISTFAGSGTCSNANVMTEGAAATSVNFYYIVGVFGDISGNIYMSYHSSARILRVSTGGLIYTFAGNGTAGFIDNVAATSSELSFPIGLYVDTLSILYFADYEGQRVRKIYQNTPSYSPTLQPTGNNILLINNKRLAALHACFLH
jgi:hypothetical protein